MKILENKMIEVENLEFFSNQKCIESLDNKLQDILLILKQVGHDASGELIDLKGCSWVMHERYYMDTEERLKWTFHHCKHRIIKNCKNILQANLERKSEHGISIEVTKG